MVEAGLTQDMLEHCVCITANFTGAALVNLRWSLIVEFERNRNSLERQVPISFDKLTEITSRTANQFSITLGNYTLPDVFRRNKDKEFLLNLNLLQNTHHHLMLMTVNEENIAVEYAVSFKKMVMEKQQTVEK